MSNDFFEGFGTAVEEPKASQGSDFFEGVGAQPKPGGGDFFEGFGAQAGPPKPKDDGLGGMVHQLATGIYGAIQKAIGKKKEEEYRANPQNFSSTRLKESLPPAQTVDEKARQDAALSITKEREKGLKEKAIALAMGGPTALSEQATRPEGVTPGLITQKVMASPTAKAFLQAAMAGPTAPGFAEAFRVGGATALAPMADLAKSKAFRIAGVPAIPFSDIDNVVDGIDKSMANAFLGYTHPGVDIMKAAEGPLGELPALITAQAGAGGLLSDILNIVQGKDPGKVKDSTGTELLGTQLEFMANPSITAAFTYPLQVRYKLANDIFQELGRGLFNKRGIKPVVDEVQFAKFAEAKSPAELRNILKKVKEKNAEETAKTPERIDEVKPEPTEPAGSAEFNPATLEKQKPEVSVEAELSDALGYRAQEIKKLEKQAVKAEEQGNKEIAQIVRNQKKFYEGVDVEDFSKHFRQNPDYYTKSNVDPFLRYQNRETNLAGAAPKEAGDIVDTRENKPDPDELPPAKPEDFADDLRSEIFSAEPPKSTRNNIVPGTVDVVGMAEGKAFNNTGGNPLWAKGISKDAFQAVIKKVDAGKPLTEAQQGVYQKYQNELQVRADSLNRQMAAREPSAKYGKAPVFFSQMERTLEQKMPNSASPEQVKGILSQGVKQEEIEWSGLDDFLQGKEKVSKKELLDFVKQNQVEIKDVTKGGDNVTNRLEELNREYNSLPENDPKRDDIFKEIRTLSDQEDLSKTTKHSSWQLPGGKNYREVLMTLPTKAPEPGMKSNRENFISGHFEEPNILAHFRLNDRTTDKGKTLFIEEIQSDWHQKGKKEGYIDEGILKNVVQRANEIAKSNLPKDFSFYDNGWFEKSEVGDGKKIANAIDKLSDELFNLGIEKGPIQDELYKLSTAAYAEVRLGQVPNAPFKKSWHELALKRILRMAVDEGYDAIAWTTGIQQTDRYTEHLRQRVKSIAWEKDKTTGVTIVDIAPTTGKRIYLPVLNGKVYRTADNASLRGKDVADVVGKEAASKIAESESGKLEGEGLTVGAEGMKGFYDQILPSFLNKYTKKWGGRVGETKITKETIKGSPYKVVTDANGLFRLQDTRTDQWAMPEKYSTEKEAEDAAQEKLKISTTVHALEITPSMKESVSKGQPIMDPGKKYGTLEPESEVAYGKDADKKPTVQLSEAQKDITVDSQGEASPLWESPFALKFKKTGSLSFPKQKISGPADVAFAFQFLRNEVQENFYLVAVKNGKAVAVEHVHVGSIDESMVSTYELIPLLQAHKADGFYMVHHHPSGRVNPSKEDFAITRKATADMASIGVEYKGHVIINGGKFGFIDKDFNPSEQAHAQYEKTNEVPVLKKYGEWKVAKDSRVQITQPEQVFEMVKGIEKEDGKALVFFLDKGNSINNAVIMPIPSVNLQTLARMAASSRSTAVILSGANLSPNELNSLNNGLKKLNIRILDSIGIAGKGYVSAQGSGLLGEPGAEYGKPQEESDSPLSVPPPIEGTEKTYGERFVRRGEIIKNLEEELKVPVRIGKFRQRALGVFKPKQKVVRIKQGSVPVVSHEVGHFLEKQFPELTPLTRTAEIRALDYDQKKKRANEGFAEFVRYYVTREGIAEKKAPVFFKKFEKWLGENPDVKTVIDKAKVDYADWRKMPSVMKVKSQINFDPAKEPIDLKKAFDEVYTGLIDDLNPIERFTQLAKEKGIDVATEEDPYILARLLKGVAGKAEHFMKYGTFDTKLNVNGKGLKEILKPIGKNIEDFNTYLISRHVPERELAGKRTGISVSDARQALIELDKKYPEFAKAAEEIDAFKDRVMKYLIESGSVSAETFNVLKKAYKYHVPFYRVVEKMGEGGHFGKAIGKAMNLIKRAKGSEREIIPPLESIIKDTYSLIDAADRNVVARAMATLAGKHSDLGRAFEKVPAPMEKAASINLADIKELQGQGIDEDVINQVINIYRPGKYGDSDNIITVNVGGKKEYYQTDPDIYAALMALNQEEAAIFIKALSYPARWLRAGATTFSDVFPLRNPIRDQFSAFVFSRYGYVPGVDLVKGLFSLTKKDELYKSFMRAGGMQSMLVSMDRDYMQAEVNDLYKKEWKNLLNPLRLMQILSEATELATRLGEFGRGVKKGASLKTAAMSGREVTLDFAKGGYATKQMNMITAFLRANINGLNRPFRAFKENPGRFSAKVALGITLPSIILYLINKDDEQYKELPRWRKDLFWIIRVPNPNEPSGQTLIMIPKPFELGIIFGTVPERIMEYIGTHDPKAFKGLAETVLGGAYADPTSWLPTAIKPVLENMTNYSFFRKSRLESQGMENLRPEDRYSYYTTKTARGLGKLFGVSPVKIENMVQGYTAAAGINVMKLLDFAVSGGKGGLPATLSDAPVTRGFVAREPVGSGSQSMNDFYDNWEKVSRSHFSMQDRRTGRDQDEFAEKHPEAFSYKLFSKASRQISKLRKSINETLFDESMPKDEKRGAIREFAIEMTRIAKDTNDIFEQEAQQEKEKKQ